MPNLDPNLTEVFNQHLTQIKPSQIRSFSKEIKDIPGLISLNVGEPGFNTPEHIKKKPLWPALQKTNPIIRHKMGGLSCAKRLVIFFSSDFI